MSSGVVAVNMIVHRRDHAHRSPEAPLTKEVYSVRLIHEKQSSSMRRTRRVRRKRTRSSLSRFITYPLAIVIAAFRSCMARWKGTSYRHGRRKTKRIVASSLVLWSFALWLFVFVGRVWYQRRALYLLLDPRGGFHPDWHPKSRQERFPDVTARVKLYMSNWYLPPCPSADNIDDRVRYDYHYEERHTLAVHVSVSHNAEAFDTYELNSDIRPDLPLMLRQNMVDICVLKDRWFNVFRWVERIVRRDRRITDHFVDHQGMRPYCEDAVEILSFASRAMQSKQNQARRFLKTAGESLGVPILAQLGDEPSSHLQHIKVPYFKKFRSAVPTAELSRVTAPPVEMQMDDPDSVTCTSERPRLFSIDENPVFGPILWVMRSVRHFGGLCQIPALDTPWEQKENKAIWRGTLTGIRAISNDDSDYENCMKMIRCRMAHEYHGSSTVDAGLSHKWPTFPATINERPIVKGFRSIGEQLRCKAIIILEGNDVATGLKWALLSRSVVLMPPPTVTSWAMEELLEPWVHYIPLDSVGSNAEERVHWIVDNDDQARKIAERATLFMHDLIFHPDADSDDWKVKTEIMRRYHEYFIHE